jgi:hypothetical protein
MTAQIGDILEYKNKTYRIQSEPLKPFLDKNKNIRFFWHSTACMRAYMAYWEIENDKLYLQKIKAILDYEGGWQQANIKKIFNTEEKVFADWYTGEIILVHGKIVKYVHLDYFTVYEKNIILEIKAGNMVNKIKVFNNKKFTDSK